MLPLGEFPIIWLVVFGAALIVLFGFTRLIQNTAQTLSSNEQLLGRRLAITMVLWPLLAIAYALTIGLGFVTFVPTLVIPIILALLVMRKPAATHILQNIPLYLLVLLGTYRVAGAVFVYAHDAHGILSYGFSFNAGWGDVLTGVLAPLVAYIVYKRMSFAFLAVVVWTIIGVGDLILAPISAQLYGAERLVDFPLNLIPLFLGPPFGIMLHLVTLRAAWLQRSVD